MKHTTKYWIQPGLAVCHRDRTDIKMYVTRILKAKGDRGMMVKGVLCHFFDGAGVYQTGEFHTGEIVPWDNREDIKRWEEERMAYIELEKQQ